MKINLRYLSVISLLFVSVTLYSQSFSEAQAVAPNYFVMRQQFLDYWNSQKKIEKGTGYAVFRRWESHMKSRIFNDGSFPPANMQQLEMEKYLKSHPQSNTGFQANWTSIGPTNSNSGYNGIGRVNAIAVDPTNSSIVWAGTPAGGLWKSTNGGNTWTTNTDYLAVLGVGAIVIDPSNTNNMYISTGDAFASDSRSIGVLRSTDGGNTWNNTGLVFTQSSYIYIRAMVMHPADPNILLVAASNGLYRTTNAGDTWTKINPAEFFDVEFNPGDPSIVYACTSNRIYRSTNDGANFTSVQTVTSSGRMALAVTPANTAVVAAVSSSGASATNGAFNGLYYSTDNGATFSLKSSTPNILGGEADGSSVKGQGWYDLCIAISPTNANTIMVGGVNLWKSINSGGTWSLATFWWNGGAPSGVPTVHADKHVMLWTANALYVGCDGGIYKTTNGGTSYTDLSNSLVISQMYRLGVSQSDSKIICGLQDNGTKLRSNSGTWTDNIGGDGMECFIHPTNSNIMYGELQRGNIQRSTNGGGNWDNIHDNVPGAPDGAWETPFVMDPTTPSTIYVGYNELYKSIDQGNNWVSISSSLNFSGNISYIAVSPVTSNTIYIANSTTVYKTTNGGTSWTNITANLPSISITYLTADPNDANTLYVTMGRYNNGEKVYKSVNGGSSWINISGTLPNLPAHCVIVEPNSGGTLYLSMEAGVYRRDAWANDWELFIVGLPNAPVQELEIKKNTKKIYAATFGRGAWVSDLAPAPGPTLTLTPSSVQFPAQGGTQVVNISTNCDWSVSGLPSWATVTPMSGSLGSYAVTITATANASTAPLGAGITFSGCNGQVVQVLQAGQLAAVPVMTLNPASASFPAAGGSQTVQLTTNCDWSTGAIPAWLTVDPFAGAPGTYTITVTAESNLSVDSLSSLILFDGCSSQATGQLQIGQSASVPALTIQPDTLAFDAPGGTHTFTLTTNCNWSSGAVPAWLSVSPLSGGPGTHTVTVQASENVSVDSLAAVLEIFGCQSAITHQVVVSQHSAVPVLTVDPLSVVFSSQGGIDTLSISTNCNWNAGVVPGWLTISPSGGGPGVTIITIQTQEHHLLEDFNTTIEINGCNGAALQEVLVHQAAAQPELTLNPASLDFASNGGSQQVMLNTNCDWTISSLPAWITVDPGFGVAGNQVLSVTVADNGSLSPLNAVLSVEGCSGATVQELTVTQAADAANLSVSGNLQFDATGGSQTVTLTTNCSWMADNIPAWLQIDPASGGAGIFTIEVTALENATIAAIQSLIHFSGCGGQVEASLTVDQLAGAPVLDVHPTSLSYGFGGGAMPVELHTNCPWRIDSIPAWVTVTPSSGAAGDFTLVIEAGNNAGPDALLAMLEVNACDGQLMQLVEVNQAPGPILNIDPDLLEFPATGGQLTFEIQTNCDWTLNGLPGWLQADPAAGNAGNQLVTLTAIDNPSVAALQAFIEVSACNGAAVLSLEVHQAAAAPVIAIDPATLNFGPLGSAQMVQLNTNCDWEITGIPAWIQIDPASGQAGNISLIITAMPNNSPDALSVAVQISGCGGVVGQTLQIQQDAPFLLAPDQVQAPASAGTVDIAVSSNTFWDAGENETWLDTPDPANGQGDTIVRIAHLANPDALPRSGIVQFSYNGQLKTVTVVQSGTVGVWQPEDTRMQVVCVPNPMTQQTNFTIRTDKQRDAVLEIISEDGRKVASIPMHLHPGENLFNWHRGKNPSGNYLYRCVFESGVISGKLILLN